MDLLFLTPCVPTAVKSTYRSSSLLPTLTRKPNAEPCTAERQIFCTSHLITSKCSCVFGICSRPAAFISCSIIAVSLWKRRSVHALQNCKPFKPRFSTVPNGFDATWRTPRVRSTFEYLSFRANLRTYGQSWLQGNGSVSTPVDILNECHVHFFCSCSHA